MASFTVQTSQSFPDGTVVGAYPRTAWLQVGPPTGAPSGSAVATATVTGGQAVFAGLADNTHYVAYAASPDRYLSFRTPLPSAASSTPAAVSGAVSGALRAEPLIRQLKRDVLLLDNGANGNGATNANDILPEQFIPDPTTGAMYLLYAGTGTGGSSIVCIAKATGTPANPAVADPTVNAFTDLGPLKASGVNITGDGPHIVVANGTYFLFTAQNTTTGSGILVRTAPQLSAGAVVPLENAVWSATSFAATPAPGNVTALAAAQGGAGSLPASLQTLGVTAVDADGVEGGYVTTTFTPTVNTAITLTWAAPATGETNGYNIYRNGQRIASVAHGTLTYSVTGAEALGAAAPTWTASPCARLDEPFIFYDDVAGQWRMVLMGFNPAGTIEQTILANLSAAGYGALTSATVAFVKQNGGLPLVYAGNHTALLGSPTPAGHQTLYDFEGTPDPFVLKVGTYFVIGYSAARQGVIATSSRFAIAAAYTKDFVTVTKLGVIRHVSAAKNPADASMGAALDARGQNRAAGGAWRGSIYVDAQGVGHLPLNGRMANNDKRAAFYSQLDLSGLTAAILGVRDVDPWRRVESDSTDARLTRVGFASVTAFLPYFSGGGLGGAGGKARFTTTPGDTITFTFFGSAVRVIVSRISTTGSVDVLLDGGGTEGVNQFTAIDMTSTSTNHDPIAAAQFDGLTPGVHTLTVRANTVGSAGVFVDCFDYIPAAGLPS